MPDDQAEDQPDVGTQIARGQITPGEGIRQQLKQTTDWIGNQAPHTPEEAARFVEYNTPGVGQALSGRDAYNAFNEGRYRDAALATIGMVPELGGIIVGRNSMHPAVAPMAKHAEELTAQGLPQNEVWRQTAERNQHPEASGAYIGPDGLPRVELGDEQATLSQLRSMPGIEGGYSFQGLNHPAAVRSYGDPDYYMHGRVFPKGPISEGAYYAAVPGERDTPWISASGRTPEDAKRAALHEIHHRIADIEGYPQGTHPDNAPFPEDMKGGAWPFYHEALAEQRGSNPNGFLSPQLDARLKSYAAFRWYQAHFGENEPEAVAERANWNREQRIATPFYESMPHPYDEQVGWPESKKAQGGLVHEHLPEYERNIDPKEAHERAKWMIPYLRAGGEAVKRGGSFYGGDEHYDRQLKALQHFYHGEQAPVAEEAPVAPEPRPQFKDGGAVIAKRVISIAEGFEEKLKGKERIIHALESANARSKNPKLQDRLNTEKRDAERIRFHIKKVRSYT